MRLSNTPEVEPEPFFQQLHRVLRRAVRYDPNNLLYFPGDEG